jgi:hypothetical protein
MLRTVPWFCVDISNNPQRVAFGGKRKKIQWQFAFGKK